MRQHASFLLNGSKVQILFFESTERNDDSIDETENDAACHVGKHRCFTLYDGGQCASTHDFHEGWYHTGWDIFGPGNKATYILASAYGVVDSITNEHNMGNCVIIRHKVVVNSKGATGTLYTLYAHLASTTVKVGQSVAGGDIIGVMGKTGNDAYPIHLHFEVKTVGVTGDSSNPSAYWGYTPHEAQNYGYVDPDFVVGHWYAIK